MHIECPRPQYDDSSVNFITRGLNARDLRDVIIDEALGSLAQMTKHAGDEINPEEPADPNGSKHLKTDSSEKGAASKAELSRLSGDSRVLSKREYHSALPQQSETQPESKKKSSTHILREASHKRLAEGAEAKPHTEKT